MIDDFLRDLDRQTDLYREMLATSDVVRVQELLQQVAGIDIRILSVRRRWPEVARTLDAVTATRAGRSIDAARDVLARLMEKFIPAPSPKRVGDVYGSLS